MPSKPPKSLRPPASSTMLGYLYQFQRSIVRLLQLPDDSDTATFEGLEDIDLVSGTTKTAVQYKYHPSQSICDSRMRWIVLRMLETFAKSEEPINYELIVHSRVTWPVTLESVDDLKRLSQYKTNGKERDFISEANISDEVLQRFMDSFTFQLGIQHEESYEQTVAALMKQFCCTRTDATEYYYQSAMELSMRLSTNITVEARTITKGDFCKKIDQKSMLSAIWNAEPKPELNIVKSLRGHMGSPIWRVGRASRPSPLLLK